MGSHSIHLDKVLREKLKKLAQEQSQRLEGKLTEPSDISREELSHSEALRVLAHQSLQASDSLDGDKASMPEIDDAHIAERWALFSENLATQNVDVEKKSAKKSIFGLHVTSYIAAAAVLVLVFFNSPWGSQPSPVGVMDDDELTVKGSVQGEQLEDLMTCRYEFIQGRLGEESVVTLLGSKTLIPAQSNKSAPFNVSIYCKAPLPLAKKPVYAHVRYHDGASPSYLSNIKIRLNSMQILNDPDDQSGSFFVLPESKNSELTLLISDAPLDDADFWSSLDQKDSSKPQNGINILDQFSTTLKVSDE